MMIGRIMRSRRDSAVTLALDMTSEAIRLMGRTPEGRWEELGVAPLDAAFATNIDALRVEALVRARGPATVELWLPEDQVMVRRYALPLGASRRAEALRRLAGETGRCAEELAVDVAPTRPDEPATVLGVLSLTIAEAREYAARWGFTPGRVSTRADAAVDFGADGPCFGPRESGARRAARPVAAGAAGMAAALAVGAMLWQAGAPQPDRPVLHAGGPGLAFAQVDARAPGLLRTPFTQVSRHGAQPLVGLPELPATGRAELALAAPVDAPSAGLAPELAQPSDGPTISIGPAPAQPVLLRPGRLAFSGGGRPADVLAQISPAAESPDRAPQTTEGAIVLAAYEPPSGADTAAVVVDALGVPAQAALGGAVSESTLVGAAGAAPALAEAAVLLAAVTTLAPRSVGIVPPVRPAAAAPDPASPGPDLASSGPDLAESHSKLAASAAPRPPARPAQKARSFQIASAAATAHRVTGKPSPASVRQAATGHGLQLDGTSLIGILDAKIGRRALIRTASGDFLKVARGEAVEGWRVSAINHDAVRLEKGGQSRTLLLLVR